MAGVTYIFGPGNWYGGMMGYAWLPLMGLFAVFWLISLVFIVWALIKIAQSRNDAGYKLIWAAIVIFLGLIGVIIYYLVERTGWDERRGRRTERSERTERRTERRR